MKYNIMDLTVGEAIS